MKKIYFLFLMTWVALSVNAQTTVTIYPAGVTGSFITGNSTSTTRTDNNIVSTAATQRGYCVFDLSGIPAGSTINTCVIGWYVNTYGGAGAASGWNMYGYSGDLSLVFTPATLFADMVTGTSLSTLTFGAAVGSFTYASTAAITNYMAANAGNKISICWTGGGTRVYTITGESGSASTTLAGHQPYLTITYCPPPTAVTATASPATLCSGATLTLNGGATGATSYSWAGPGSYSSGTLLSTLTTTVGSAGIYTLTATNSCGTFSATATATTTSVVVNPLPAAITGSAAVCSGGGTTTLTDISGAGTWSSSSSATAQINSTSGLVTGVVAGTSTIQFTLNSTGCSITSTETVNNTPAAISGATQVCSGSNITLIETSGGGGWSNVAGTGTATVGGTGIVNGGVAGTDTVEYTIAGCPPAVYPIVVNSLPAAITGTTNVCNGFSTTLNDITGTGTWSSSNTFIASVGSSTGIVTGNFSSGVTIYYTLPTGCRVSTPFTVNANPNNIAGPTSVCPDPGVTINLTDATGGGTWLSADATIATVVLGTGVVSGVASGVTYITYTVTATGCYNTKTITVYPLPATPVSSTGSTTLCQNSTVLLTDTDPGGTWSSSNTAIATAGSSSAVVTGTGGGVANITYTLATGCYSMLPVTINAAPVAVITALGPTTFCAGGNVTLSATAGGTMYQWFNNGVLIAGATNPTYLVTTTASYTVLITNAAGCSTLSAAEPVTASIHPTITSTGPSTSFCIGGNTVLEVTTSGIVGSLAYQWLLNGVVIPGANLINYYTAMSGNYQCIVTISGGSGSCIDTTPAISVNVFPLPTPVADFNGINVYTSPAYVSYQWFLNTVGVSGATSYSYVPTLDGAYNVRVTDVNGCVNFSNTVGVYVVSVPQVNKADIKIYPNPANSVLHIESNDIVHAVITDMEGKSLIDQQNARDMNITELPGGLYLLILYDQYGQRLTVKKITKE